MSKDAVGRPVPFWMQIEKGRLVAERLQAGVHVCIVLYCTCAYVDATFLETPGRRELKFYTPITYVRGLLEAGAG